MPKRLIKRAWGEGVRDPAQLAELFVVSPQAMHIRLQTIGLLDVPMRHRPISASRTDRTQSASSRRYWRQLSRAFTGVTP